MGSDVMSKVHRVAVPTSFVLERNWHMGGGAPILTALRAPVLELVGGLVSYLCYLGMEAKLGIKMNKSLVLLTSCASL